MIIKIIKINNNIHIYYMHKIIILLLILIILILYLKYNTSENFNNNISFLNKYKTDKWSELGFNDKLKNILLLIINLYYYLLIN
jgi:hypothetical protein